MGRQLAREHPVEADLVIPTPESGTPAAIGYAQESGIPYGQGLVKNSYVGRTFIAPSQTIRQLGIRLKLNPLREVIRGKRLVVVDDSIVRGNTQRALVRMLREAGAAEVHVRISSPPVQLALLLRHRLRHPGRADRHRASASRRSAPASAPTASATSARTAWSPRPSQPRDRLCTACFTGIYPIELPQRRPARQARAGDARLRCASASAADPDRPGRTSTVSTGVAGGRRRAAPDDRDPPPASEPRSRRATPSRSDVPMSLSVPAGAPITYAAAGVDVEAGDRAVELMKASVAARASGPRCSAASAASPGMFDASRARPA